MLTVTTEIRCGEKCWKAYVVFKPEDMYEERIRGWMHLFELSLVRALLKSDLVKLTDETRELVEADRAVV